MKVSYSKKWIFVVALVLLLFMICFLPIPVSQSASVNINAPYQRVFDQVGSLDRWKAWWPDSSGIVVTGDTVFRTPQTEYSIRRKQALGLILTQAGKPVYHVITATPAPNGTTTDLHWKKISYLGTAIADKVKSIFGSRDYAPEKLLGCIKENMEDPVKFYGFNIRVEPVADTFILVKNIFCPKARLGGSILEIYQAVRHYLDAVHYTGRAEKMFHVDSSMGLDSLRVMAGFSITRLLPVHPPLQMLQMPKAHMVVGDYTGDYNQISRIHAAMDAYMKDHGIAPVAIVYEKMLTDPRTAQDSLHVRVRVYHPPLIP